MPNCVAKVSIFRGVKLTDKYRPKRAVELVLAAEHRLNPAPVQRQRFGIWISTFINSCVAVILVFFPMMNNLMGLARHRAVSSVEFQR